MPPSVSLRLNVVAEGVETAGPDTPSARALSAEGHKKKRKDKVPSREGKVVKLPTFMYIGVGHSGSTSLCAQMNRHPEISHGSQKEHRFFCASSRIKHTTMLSYNNSFWVEPEIKHTYDCTPSTLFCGLPGLTKIHSFFPTRGVEWVKDLKAVLGDAMKFIVMMRDPLDYKESKSGASTSKLCFAESLKSWLAVYPRENFLFLRSEDFFKDNQRALTSIFDFLGVAPKHYTAEELISNGRRRAPHTPLASREKLYAEPWFQKCKKDLENLTGMAWPWGTK